jgi:hypothetical protein
MTDEVPPWMLPWLASADPDWVAKKHAIVRKYEEAAGPGSYRQLSLMLSAAWDEWEAEK